MITPWVVNPKAYTHALLLTRDVCFCWHDAWRNWVAVPTLITYPEWAMFPWNRDCYNLCLSGRQPLLKFRLACCQETLLNSILGSGERCARLRSQTRRPLRLPLLWRHCVGLPTGIRSIVLGGGPKQRIHSGKAVFLVVMLVSWRCSYIQ
jgi:hypothetical protein